MFAFYKQFAYKCSPQKYTSLMKNFIKYSNIIKKYWKNSKNLLKKLPKDLQIEWFCVILKLKKERKRKEFTWQILYSSQEQMRIKLLDHE